MSVGEDRARAVAAARAWFELGFEMLGGRLRETVLGSTESELAWESRDPGATNAGVFVRLLGDFRLVKWTKTYSPAVWQGLLNRLAEIPVLASFEVQTNNERGRPGYPAMTISSQKFVGVDMWLLLNLDFSEHYLDSMAGQDAVLRFVRAVADQSNPGYGEVSFFPGLPRTELEFGLGLSLDEMVPKSREILRGYGWLTILAEELGQRLGGLPALRASGAFVEVDHLAAGGFWLRATERLEDYQMPQAEKVFEVLAPVLPPGVPAAPRGSGNILVARNPRDSVH